jgi:hypothetical protein
MPSPAGSTVGEDREKQAQILCPSHCASARASPWRVVEEGARFALMTVSSPLRYTNSLSIARSSRSSAVPSPSTGSPSSHPIHWKQLESGVSDFEAALQGAKAISPPCAAIVSVALPQRLR